MKKTSKKFALLTTAMLMTATVLLPAIEATPAHATEVATLSMGMNSSAVVTLQENLRTLGYFTYPTSTGYYGSVTAQAVSSYQTAYTLPATGTADATTQTSIAHALVKKNMVADMWNYQYVPYKWGGATPDGFDCSGFIHFMHTKHGIPSVRTTSAVLFTQGTPVPTDKLMPGDLVFFSLNGDSTISHVGFYIGNNQFMSATSSKGIYPQNIYSSYWGPKYRGAKRVY